MGCAALLLTSSLAVVPTHAQPADPLPLDVRLRTVVVQGTLWSEDWGPNPGPNDAPGVRLPVEILPSIVRQCTPLSCPPEPLGASPVTLGPGGFFTMPVVLPEQLLSDTNVVGLQFSVRTNNDQPFTLLSGTLPFAATPFATVAQSVAGPIPAELLTGSMPTGMLRSAFTSPLALTNAGNVLAGDGSRVAHVDAATLGGFAACNLPCYWNLSGNAGTDPDADFIGTTDGAALTIGVGNLAALRINRSAGPGSPPNLVGGDPANSISPGSRGSVIGGGGAADQPNVVSEATFGVIGGGLGNQVRDRGNSIVGGANNRAGGTNSVVGGGGMATVPWGTMPPREGVQGTLRVVLPRPFLVAWRTPRPAPAVLQPAPGRGP
jgi:hypothetical protein